MTSFLATLFTAQSWLFAQAAANSDVAPVGTPGHGALGNGWLHAIIIGFVIGFIAKFLTPGREPAGCIITILIGIGGSIVAYFLGSLVGLYGNGHTPGIIASVIGAIILLVIYHAIIGRKNV